MKRSIKMTDNIMSFVYGNFKVPENQAWIPKPLPPGEAGDYIMPPGKEVHQRRYLWTDAFGVLNFLSLALKFKELGDNDNFRFALRASRSLIHTVHEVLGNPMDSNNFPMTKRLKNVFEPPNEILTLAPSSLSDYKGLRIGKTHSKKHSDMGMKYDGMYYHYIDKWLFCLCQYARIAKDIRILRDAVQIVHDIHPSFFVKDRGMRWKINVDMTPISDTFDRAAYSSDDVEAMVVYHILRETSRELKDEASVKYMEGPLNDARSCGISYFMKLSPRFLHVDPLGWGMDAWVLQWLLVDDTTSTRTRISARKKETEEMNNSEMDKYFLSLQSHQSGIEDKIRLYYDRLLANAPHALDIRYFHELPFRLYGAMIGAQCLFGDRPEVLGQVTDMQNMIVSVLNLNKESNEYHHDLHSSINNVMLASMLHPGVLKKY